MEKGIKKNHFLSPKKKKLKKRKKFLHECLRSVETYIYRKKNQGNSRTREMRMRNA